MASARDLEERSRQMVAELQNSFEQGFTRSYQWRREQLNGLLKMLKTHYKDIIAALTKDLRKPELESDLCEVAPTEHEIINTLKNLKSWMRPEAVGTPGWLLPAHSEIRRDPYGVVLIIAPFNYPFQLAAIPLVNALAAGNCVMLKPSELTPATSALLARLLPCYVDRRALRVVEGGVPETTALLNQKWDMIFFTGSETVGRIVHQAAAKTLTPCILELGGKSPCVVDESVRDISLAAKRIVWGKLINSGQTCIAPDYVVCHRSVARRLIDAMVNEVKVMTANNAKDSPDLTRIVSERHAQRLAGLLAEGHGKVEVGGDVDVKNRYIAPTIVSGINSEAKLMKEEIFGPILPVVEVGSVDEAIKVVKDSPDPLALYVFASDKRVCERVMDAVPSGGVCLNDTLMHFVASTLPFGGVGTSGLGRYHGKFAFDTFSHVRGVLRRWDHWLGDVPLRYAPYNKTNHKIFRALADALQGHRVHTVVGGVDVLLDVIKLGLMAIGIYQIVAWIVAASH